MLFQLGHLWFCAVGAVALLGVLIGLAYVAIRVGRESRPKLALHLFGYLLLGLAVLGMVGTPRSLSPLLEGSAVILLFVAGIVLGTFTGCEPFLKAPARPAHLDR